jgi:Lrp/AsnC family transcriptional regulator for asnA, asnC and gidA
MTYELDGLDRKILVELDKDSRQPITILSKKLHKARNVIEYRIKKLQDEGIIKNFATLLDAGKFGVMIWNIYLEFQETTPAIEKKMIEFLKKNKKVWWTAQCAGKWNMIISFVVKDVKELHDCINNFHIEFGKYILNQEIASHVEAEIFSRSYFTNQPSEGVSWLKEIKKEDIDETDRKILGELSTNSRVSSVDIAEKINTTERIVIYRIKDLIKRKIISRFRLQLDISKLGYSFYKVIVNLKNYSVEKDSKLKEYCKELGNVFHYEKKVGPWMLELEMETKNYEHTNDMMKTMKERFPDFIKSYDLILITNEPIGELDLTKVL